jgi:hypothetical protein
MYVVKQMLRCHQSCSKGINSDGDNRVLVLVIQYRKLCHVIVVEAFACTLRIRKLYVCNGSKFLIIASLVLHSECDTVFRV